MITDFAQANDLGGIHIHCVKNLRGSNSKEILKIINDILPNVIVVSVTPMSMMTCGWYRSITNIKKIAFFSYSPYTKKEIFNSIKFLSLKEKFEYGKHMLIPEKKFSIFLEKYFYASICQSVKTFERLKLKNNKLKNYYIPPGIDKNIWVFKKSKANYKTKFLYTGSPLHIRGFFVLLDALSLLKNRGMHLTILARGADRDTIKSIHQSVNRRGLASVASVRGGWLSFEDLQQEICHSDMVLLPFVLVPSELPVTLMESIACGTPVLVTDIDGLPSAIGEAGVVAPHADVSGLAETMLQVHESLDLKRHVNQACFRERNRMESWDSIGKKWMQVFKQ